MKPSARIIRVAACVLAAGALSACATDPAFWDALAMSADQIAYEAEAQAAGCPLASDGSGRPSAYCAPNPLLPDVVYLPGVD